ncbi:hypothetical protein ACSVBT_13485 [Afipia sp. TerB]
MGIPLAPEPGGVRLLMSDGPIGAVDRRIVIESAPYQRQNAESFVPAIASI